MPKLWSANFSVCWWQSMLQQFVHSWCDAKGGGHWLKNNVFCMMRTLRGAAAHFCFSRLHKPGRPWELITSNRIALERLLFFRARRAPNEKYYSTRLPVWCQRERGITIRHLGVYKHSSLVGHRNRELSEILDSLRATTLLKRHAFQNSWHLFFVKRPSALLF